MRLFVKLVLSFVLVSIIPLGIAALTAYVNGREAISHEITTHLTSTNILRGAEVARWFEEKGKRLSELARRPLIKEYVKLLNFPGSTEREMEDAAGRIYRDHLKITLEEEGGFIEMFLLGAGDGQVISSTDERQVGKFRENEPYFIEGKKGTFIQNAYYSLVLEQPVITLGTPIKDHEGNVVGVMCGHVDLAELSLIMRKGRGVHETEESYLVNRFNFMITESRFEPNVVFNKAIYTEGVKRGLRNINGSDEYLDYRSVMVIGAYNWMPVYEVVILTEIDKSEAVAPIVGYRNFVITLGILTTMIVIVMGIFIARTITKPVSELTKGAEELGRGNLDHRINVDSVDELGDLARSFNSMIQQIQERDRELKYSHELDRLIQDIAASFIQLDFDLDRQLNKAIRLVSEFTGADRCTVIEVSDDDLYFNMSHEWVVEGIQPDMERTQNVPLSELGLLMELYKKGRVFNLSSLDDLPPEGAYLKKSFEAKSVKSFLGFPMLSRGKLIGVLALVHVQSEKQWKSEEIKLLGILANLFTGAIIRDKTQKTLLESEDRFRTAFITSPDTIAITRLKDGVIVNVNEGFTNWTGMKREEAIGKKASDLKIWENMKERDRFIRDLILSGQVENFESTFRKKGGGKLIGLVSGRLIKVGGEPHVLSITRDITDRKRTEEAVLQIAEGVSAQVGEKFFSSLVKHLGEALKADCVIVGVTDPDRQKVRTLAVFAGGEEAPNMEYDLAGTPCGHIVDGEVCAFVSDVQQQFPEDPFLVKMGIDAYVGAPLTDSDGNLTGILVSMFAEPLEESGQVSSTLQIFAARASAELQRKEAEDALVASEERFRTAFFTSPDVIIINRAEDGVIVDVNEGFSSTVGYSREEILGKSTVNINVWEDLEVRDAAIRELNEHGYVENVETQFIRKDGSKFTGLMSTKMITLNHEAHRLSVIKDISEKKIAEREIEKYAKLLEVVRQVQEDFISEQSLPAIFDNLMHAYVDLTESEFGFIGEIQRSDDDEIFLKKHAISIEAWDVCESAVPAKIKFSNPESLFGEILKTSSPVISNQLSEDLRSGELPGGHPPLTSFLALPFVQAGKFLGMVGVANRPGGYDQELIEFLKPLTSSCSNIIEAFRNDQMREEAEAQIRRLNEELEERVERRTEQMQAANKELESFAYSVSHDLRAPLRSIDGFSVALMESYQDELDETGVEYLGRIRNASQQMARLIDDLLELSKLTRSEMVRDVVDLSEISRKVAGELQMTYPERQVEVNVADGITVNGDKHLLYIMLKNLLENAWKFTGKSNGAKIDFGCEFVGDECVYFVRDNGAGFDMKYVDKLFVAFQRLHSVREFEGTGIGLATVQRIINRHNGRVWAESTEGEGATFFFVLDQIC